MSLSRLRRRNWGEVALLIVLNHRRKWDLCDDKKGKTMADVAPRRRSRGGGGAARRAERTSVKVEAAKFIERNIPTFDILNQEA